VVTTVREIDLGKSLPGATEIDLYLWVMDYQWYLKQGLSHIKKDDKEGNKEIDDSEAERHLLLGNPQMPVRKLINALNRSNTLETILFKQERALFNEKTHIALLRPGTEINSTLPGSYDRIEEHISAHRWYLGEKLGSSVSYEEAVISWYDNLYLPIVKIIHDQDILSNFPGRSETDLYLWIIEHQWYLNQEYGEQVSFEQAAEVFAEDFVTREKKKGRADCSN
jgi:hypothetical protein